MRTLRLSRHLARGFTLVEVLVAISLTGIGLMALAGTTGVLVMRGSTAAAAVQASVRLASVLDSLRLVPCASLASGRSAAGAIVVTWTVSAPAAARRISATVAWGVPRPRTAVTETSVLCP